MATFDCPRQIIFTIPGNPAVKVTATEVAGGKIDFKIDVLDTSSSTGDLRGFFFDYNEAKLGGMTVTSTSPLLTGKTVAKNAVIDLGDGANLSGATKAKFDVGLKWGTPGTKPDDINFEVGFTLDNAAHNLTLDDIVGMRFGAKLDSVGGPGGPRSGASKLIGVAPAAPDAKDDSFTNFEDGSAAASKTPTNIVLDVLKNDTDADGQALKITDVHALTTHGSFAKAVDGKSIIYTPELDYSGTVSVEYCITDSNGGQDHATATLVLAAVADDPVFNVSVAQGSDINHMLVTVTATQNDADGSEFLDNIVLSVPGGVPVGSSVTPGFANPAGQPNSVTQVFTVTTPAMQDVDFNIDFTAKAVEKSNLDDETSDYIQNIAIDYTHNQGTLNYIVTDQSIWDTGDAFVFDLHKFLGVNIDEHGGDSFDVGPVTVAGYSYDVALKAGFQLDVHFEAGGIDANIPIDVTVDSTYNKTLDTIYLTSSSALGSGGSFLTHGPEGAVNLDLIFNYLLAFSAFSDIFPDIDIGPFQKNFTQNLFHFDSASFGGTFDPIPAITIDYAWPHIAVANDPGTLSGSGESNPALTITADIDQIANFLLSGALSFLDDAPPGESDFELADLDIAGALKLLQDFAIGYSGAQNVTLILEDDTHVAMTLGTPLTITNASSHDANHDGHIGFHFDYTPTVELTNSTSIGVDVHAELAFVRNLDLGVADVTVFDDPNIPLFSTGFEVFNDTFALNGVGAQTFNFIA